MASRSKALCCGRSLVGIAGSTLRGGHGRLSVGNVVCFQVQVPASGLSLIPRSSTECGVSECDYESLMMRKSWPTKGCCAVVYTCVYMYIHICIYNI